MHFFLFLLWLLLGTVQNTKHLKKYVLFLSVLEEWRWFGSQVCNSFPLRRPPHEPSVISELSKPLLPLFQVLTHSDAQRCPWELSSPGRLQKPHCWCTAGHLTFMLLLLLNEPSSVTWRIHSLTPLVKYYILRMGARLLIHKYYKQSHSCCSLIPYFLYFMVHVNLVYLV